MADHTKMQISESPGTESASPYRRPLAWPVGALLFDSIVAGAPSLGFLACLVLAARQGVLAAARVFSARGKARRHVVALGSYVLAGAAIMAVFTLQNQVGRSNAERIIAGVEAARSASGHYPASLTEITPRYLPEIPPCAYRLVLPCGYSYREVNGRHVLAWTEAPPYGVRVYEFETAEWRYLD